MSRLVLQVAGLALLAGCAQPSISDRQSGDEMDPRSQVDLNKTVVKRFYSEFMNRRRVDVLPDLVAKDIVNHSSGTRGIDGLPAAAETLHIAFQDLHFEVMEAVGEGDAVAIRYVLRGKSVGPFAGQAPTGQWVERPGINLLRLQDGKIREVWLAVDPRTVRPPAPKSN